MVYKRTFWLFEMRICVYSILPKILFTAKVLKAPCRNKISQHYSLKADLFWDLEKPQNRKISLLDVSL